MSTNNFVLPSVLKSQPAVQDDTTTVAQLGSMLGKVTTPAETPIFLCAYSKCFKLFPSADRLAAHRKMQHQTDDEQEHVISWNR